MNNDASEYCDKHKSDWLVPHFRPNVDVCSEPARDRLVVTQTHNQTHHPTGEVQHPMNKPAAVAVEQAQGNHDYQQNVDRINSHRIRVPILIADCQFAIADLWLLPALCKSAIGNRKLTIIPHPLHRIALPIFRSSKSAMAMSFWTCYVNARDWHSQF